MMNYCDLDKKKSDLTIDIIYEALISVCKLDLMSKSRKDEYITLRSIFYKLCYDNLDYLNDYTAHSAIAEFMGKDRVTVRHSLAKTEYNMERSYKYNKIYNEVMIKLGIPVYKNSEGLKTLTKSNEILKAIRTLESFTECEILEFNETRLKPFKKALESRVMQKVIPIIKGATLNKHI